VEAGGEVLGGLSYAGAGAEVILITLILRHFTCNGAALPRAVGTSFRLV